MSELYNEIFLFNFDSSFPEKNSMHRWISSLECLCTPKLSPVYLNTIATRPRYTVRTRKTYIDWVDLPTVGYEVTLKIISNGRRKINREQLTR